MIEGFKMTHDMNQMCRIKLAYHPAGNIFLIIDFITIYTYEHTIFIFFLHIFLTFDGIVFSFCLPIML